MKTKYLLMITLTVLFMLFITTDIYADGITIGNGSNLSLNDASMSLGCLDITIEDGGILDVGSATITRLSNLNIITGGSFIPGTGAISYCGILPYGMLELLLLD